MALLILFGAYLSVAVKGSKKAFFAFAILFLVSYLLTSILYFANSVEVLLIILNVLFLLLGVFHNLRVFKVINSIFSSDSASDKKLKHELSKYNLTPRQEEIAILVIKGYRSKEIADMCDISPGAERKHVSNINAAIGVSSRIELTKKFSYLL
ncbi:MAG: helix-turn-helix transcriptional regulator [bacterium]|nr:helix-turn-helix transcriptional regulator [bacterium]